jgi:hypothetical protein
MISSAAKKLSGRGNSMSYFRADGHLMAQMVHKDYIRYDKENVASLLTVFALKQNNKTYQLPVVIVGEEAERLHRLDLITAASTRSAESEPVNDSNNPKNYSLGSDTSTVSQAWYEIKGQLISQTINYEGYELPKLLLKAVSVTSIPAMSSSLMRCEMIGRLTFEPEHISKTDSYDFVKFALAINRAESSQASFFDISVFKSNLVELVQTQVHKGQTVYAAGELSFYLKGQATSVYTSVKLDQLRLMDKASLQTAKKVEQLDLV